MCLCCLGAPEQLSAVFGKPCFSGCGRKKNAFAKMPNAGEQLKQTPHCTCPQYPRDCQLNEAKPAPEHKRSAPKVAIVTVQRPISRRHYLATRCAPGCMHMRMGVHMHVHFAYVHVQSGFGFGFGLGLGLHARCTAGTRAPV